MRSPRSRSATTASRATRASLHDALTRPYPAYEAVGIKNPGGEYNQLATTLLQIENEFYGTIRPKRVIRPGERPLHALRERGVEYVEVRCMDLDPFEPVGIDAQTMRFLDIFLLHCLLTDSPPDTPQEIAALERNQQRTAARGREPGLMLERGGGEVALVDWGGQVLAHCEPIAAALDAAHGGTRYRDALADARRVAGHARSVPFGARAGSDHARLRCVVRRLHSCAVGADTQCPAGVAVSGGDGATVRGDGESLHRRAPAHRGRRHVAVRGISPGLSVSRAPGLTAARSLRARAYRKYSTR